MLVGTKGVAMKWLVLIAVIAVLFALAWWSSGRSRPLRGRRRHMTDTEKDAFQGYAQRHSHNSGGGFGI